MGSALDRIILLGAAHGFVIEDLKSITAGSTFLYEKEIELQNVLLESFIEMAFVVQQFQSAHAYLLANGTPELPEYVKQLNDQSLKLPPDMIIELHAVDLSAYFKSFLILAKAVLDKLVPLYSYRFYDSVRQFSDKGARLVRAINQSRHVNRKPEMVDLITRAKAEWIDRLIDLRDNYIHYSNLKEYQNFWISGECVAKGNIHGINEFNKPLIKIEGVHIDALEYILQVKNDLIAFLNQFLLLCEFTPGRRPKHYLDCECGHSFAKRRKVEPRKGQLELTRAPLELRVKNHELDYAVIICPKCHSTTDTDLKFWRDEGFDFTKTSESSSKM